MKRLANYIVKKKWRFLILGLVAVLVVLCLAVFLRFNFSSNNLPKVASWQSTFGINRPANSGKAPMVQVVGHRGSGLTSRNETAYIGNTLRAIANGVDAADWIEIDIRKSRDNVLMLFHDKDLVRVVDRASLADSVKGKRFGELNEGELRKLRINVDPPEKIPTLEEVLRKYADENVRFVIDIKDDSITNADLLPLVRQYLSSDRVILFGTAQILEKFQGEEFELGYTALWSEGWNRAWLLFGNQFFLDRTRRLGANYLVLPSIFLNQSLIDDAIDEGLCIWAYGVHPDDWKGVIQLGVSGLIVDQPSLARDNLDVPKIKSWHAVQDFEENLAVFESVFWDPRDTESLRKLIREEEIAANARVLEIGTGSGLLALCSLAAGAKHVVATDVNPAAVKNAAFNANQLKIADHLDVRLVPLSDASAFSVIAPDEKFDLIISNPPWVNRKPASIAEYALYDANFALMKSLLDGLGDHLNPGGRVLLAYGCVDAIKTLEKLANEHEFDFIIRDTRDLDRLPEEFLPGMMVEIGMNRE